MVDSSDSGSKPKSNSKLVGSFIRKKRIASGLSQRALGQLFSPPVTTQFVSNVERGVTPLPPHHVANLSKVLKISEAEILSQLEKEYTAKLSGRLGVEAPSQKPSLDVLPAHYDFMKSFYEAYVQSDEQSRTALQNAFQQFIRSQGSKPKTPF